MFLYFKFSFFQGLNLFNNRKMKYKILYWIFLKYFIVKVPLEKSILFYKFIIVVEFLAHKNGQSYFNSKIFYNYETQTIEIDKVTPMVYVKKLDEIILNENMLTTTDNLIKKMLLRYQNVFNFIEWDEDFINYHYYNVLLQLQSNIGHSRVTRYSNQKVPLRILVSQCRARISSNYVLVD